MIMRDKHFAHLRSLEIYFKKHTRKRAISIRDDIRYECSSPCLHFRIQRDGIAKVDKFFPIDMEATTTSNSRHGQNPKHLMKNLMNSIC